MFMLDKKKRVFFFRHMKTLDYKTFTFEITNLKYLIYLKKKLKK